MKTYELITTTHGYILTNGIEKLVMNISKKAGSAVPYYLKKVEPIQEYLTGLFYDKKKNEYYGKTADGTRVKVQLGLSTANVFIN
jgi:hypothetical protein